jgi:uncharacterized protein YkwD
MLYLNINMIKNLFIPHKGNNYQPQALHPKHLLFHGVAAIVIKTLVLIALLVLPASAWLTPDVMTAESQKIITLTNNLRAEKGVKPLLESALLDQAAFNKAQDMLVGQYFSHMSPANKNMVYWLNSVAYGYAVAGENLAMGFSSGQNVVTAWTKSKTHYANLIDPDFKEIGVAMTSGNFHDHDTTLVAQYFGTPKVAIQAVKIQPQTASASEAIKDKIVIQAKPSIKGEKVVANPVIADQMPPNLDLAKTKIWVNQPVGQKDKIVMVEAYLSPDTETAQVSFQNIVINLSPDSQASDKWTGSAIIAHDDIEQTFSPIVLANLTAQDQAGNVLNTDINWSNYQEIKPSLVQQYLFIKNSSSGAAKSLVGASRIYFTLLLVVCLIALLLNIFIEIKKQHPHIIASALGLICLLILLIII